MRFVHVFLGVALGAVVAGGCGTTANPEPEGQAGAPGTGGKSTSGGSGGSASAGSGGSGGTAGASGGSGGQASAGSGGSPAGGSGGSQPGGSGGAAGGSGGAAGGSGGAGAQADAGAAPSDGGGGQTFAGTHPSCPNCKSLFNGKDLTGWMPIGAEKWEAVDSTILSTGASGGALVTTGDYDHYRLFFSWKMLSGGHAANMLTLCRDRTKRNCAGIQFQNPGSDLWDYGPADGRVPKDKGMLLPGRASVPQGQSGMCEMIVKASAGTFKVACCNLMGGGVGKTCKTVPSATVTWGEPFPKGPLGFQAHNPNHKIHWWDIFIEENPTSDDYLSK